MRISMSPIVNPESRETTEPITSANHASKNAVYICPMHETDLQLHLAKYNSGWLIPQIARKS